MRLKSGLNSLKEVFAGATGANQEQVALRQTGLNRRHVAGLQQLGLQQFTDPGDLMAREDRIGIGQKSMGRRVVGRVCINGVVAFHQGPLLKAQVAVYPGLAGAAGGQIRIQQQLGTVNGPVVVELDGSLHVMQGLHRPVGGLLGNGVIEVWRRVVGVQLLGDLVFALIQPGALFLVKRLAQVAADQ